MLSSSCLPACGERYNSTIESNNRPSNTSVRKPIAQANGAGCSASVSAHRNDIAEIPPFRSDSSASDRTFAWWALGAGQLRYPLPRRCGVTLENEGLMT